MLTLILFMVYIDDLVLNSLVLYEKAAVKMYVSIKRELGFLYVRQEATSGVQENFLFNINKSGEVRAYDIDGNILKVVYTDKALTPKDVNEIVEFGVDFDDYNECESAEYLKHGEDDALRSVAINDLIVVANPEDFTSMNSARDNDAAAPYEAFIDVRQLVYDREYKLGFEEINSSLNPSGINYTTVTGLNLDDTDKFKIEANRTGDCPLIVNGQLTVDHTYLAPGSTNNNNPTGLKIEIETRALNGLFKREQPTSVDIHTTYGCWKEVKVGKRVTELEFIIMLELLHNSVQQKGLIIREVILIPIIK